MDLAKYREIFVEESTEHLSEMGAALLSLEKQSDDTDAIDLIFRMAHSIKGMAASLSFDSVTELAHCLEDPLLSLRRVALAVQTVEGVDRSLADLTNDAWRSTARREE